MSSSYAPPSHPPPDRAGGTSNIYANYAPTTVPTAGQALLKNGKMLVYPHGWKGCAKCNDTGYKQGDPSNPCRKCWQDYGQSFNPLLISSSGLQGAKVLQRPLPVQSRPTGSTSAGPMPGSFSPYPSSHSTGYAGYPGASQSFSPTSPHSTGLDYAPPSHAPPPSNVSSPPPQPQRRPPVSRTDESREDDLNENGEAPPAYEDAIAAGPDGALPPQRANETPQQQRQNHSFSPPSHPPAAPHATGMQHQAYGSHATPPPHQQQQPYFMPMHGPPAMATAFGPQYMPYGHRPPPHALVVRPGDPRIGGRLCYKCGGDGIREDFWFGSRETCRTCGGTGRIM